ncbi:NUDIX hydrolase [Streptacidiphilus jiangxiensis]|uniref:8-oxo-dGTP pyrophosphatase MutT, NUDIX family n=1 Tax=Streptacidiphilus jiangxiensis TaxID=235985 RepID=A0A1H7NQG0_STRJI|nr:NUDIX domain-containing protein [Streptacidiphilus jiangxiensis]SEL25227.1 8-oxo-dGTP pyrophosphatase MutT, NUDIX family [Streptacidiphilus jiangxiensis]
MITNGEVAAALSAYLALHPEEESALSEPLQLLRTGMDVTSRRTLPMHVTAGALLVRHGREILLIKHRAYQILLQPGGHVEPTDTGLLEAAARELVEETGIDPSTVTPSFDVPAYIEYGLVAARPDKGEPAHHHLDFGYAFTTEADAGHIQESEVTYAGWFPVAEAERLVGRRIARATDATALLR